jgi:tRNA pseudouridine38-40 synthase
MLRFLITIEYDGRGYIGWQRQDTGLSVQQCLEEAASAVTGGRQQVTVYGAGRTDAGVHATGQTAHFDLPRGITPNKLPLALNAYLPPDIRVLKAIMVDEDFHARFDAIGRAYRYQIHCRRIPSPLLIGRAWHVSADLDVAAMQMAAERLIGSHDFTSFRATQCQSKSPMRTMEILRFEKGEDGHLALIAEARSFLHHQIRNIAGTLVQVGKGKWTADDVSQALAARTRAAAGPTAPPEGLYLTRVDYPSPKHG